MIAVTIIGIVKILFLYRYVDFLDSYKLLLAKLGALY